MEKYGAAEIMRDLEAVRGGRVASRQERRAAMSRLKRLTKKSRKSTMLRKNLRTDT